MINRREFQKYLAAAVTTSFVERYAYSAMLRKRVAVDAHAHVFTRDLKLASVHRYVPDYDAKPETLIRLIKDHGFGHCVLIQPSFLGADNSFLLSVLRAHPHIFRGVTVIKPDIAASEIAAMHAVGCVGIRLNLFGLPNVDLTSTAWNRVFQQIAGLGWHVEVHAEAQRMPTLLTPLRNAGINVVVDHFGRPDPKLGVNDPGFKFLLDAAESRHVWIKISGAYRNGADGRGEQIALESIPLLKKSFGLDRMMWGSDWPHTQFESQENYDKAYDFLLRMVPDKQERRAVLVDTPDQLFQLERA